MSEQKTPIANRWEFIFLFDCENGNPNGDPDAGNMPRVDPQDMRGLVSDVALKRRIRNYVQRARGNQPPYAIFIEHATNLNVKIATAYDHTGGIPEDRKPNKKEVGEARKWLCQNFFDVRCFGAVLSTGPNAGQVRGPVQFAFARSVDPVLPLDLAITRVAVAGPEGGEQKKCKSSADYQKWEDEQPEDELRTMGRKTLIPYGLYVAKGFISAHLAEDTGFSNEDLKLFWEALLNMFEHDRSASKGVMTVHPEYAVAFKHVGNSNDPKEAKLGCAPAHKLFELYTRQIRRKAGVEAARSIHDYELPSIEAIREALPKGVEVCRIADLLKG